MFDKSTSSWICETPEVQDFVIWFGGTVKDRWVDEENVKNLIAGNCDERLPFLESLAGLFYFIFFRYVEFDFK